MKGEVAQTTALLVGAVLAAYGGLTLYRVVTTPPSYGDYRSLAALVGGASAAGGAFLMVPAARKLLK